MSFNFNETSMLQIFFDFGKMVLLYVIGDINSLQITRMWRIKMEKSKIYSWVQNYRLSGFRVDAGRSRRLSGGRAGPASGLPPLSLAAAAPAPPSARRRARRRVTRATGAEEWGRPGGLLCSGGTVALLLGLRPRPPRTQRHRLLSVAVCNSLGLSNFKVINITSVQQEHVVRFLTWSNFPKSLHIYCPQYS